jgi:hypothetical protein
MSLYNSYISYGKSNPTCVHMMQRPSSEEWPMIYSRCVLWIKIAWLFITMLHWTVTIWSSLEACLRSVSWFKVRADLNTLNHLKVIWSNMKWYVYVIGYFSSVINLYKRRSNEILVGFVIWTLTFGTVGGHATNSAIPPPWRLDYKPDKILNELSKIWFGIWIASES